MCCVDFEKEPCPCGKRKKNARKGPTSLLDRSTQARTRNVGTSVFELPSTQTTPTTADSTPTPAPTPREGTTYSTCTSVGQNRVSVVESNGRYMCSRPECKT
ncbi:unnamed protein product [Ectocarpus sp. CCAP 1310/34]|nr:unnamed protein product [Ectocarpus sp. CCAP 1310/34]